MTLVRLFLPFLSLVLTTEVRAQQSVARVDPEPHTWYFTSGGEWIFSHALLDVNNNDQGSIVRFSPFFNAQGVGNYDFSGSAGMFLGLSIRNVGFIYDVPDTSLRFKFRTYNLGVPIGLKFGRMNGPLFFVGYEPELVLNYKEKRFENEKKEDKFNVWFSDRTELFTQSVMAGFQFGNGACLKVKYYFTNFHNQGFSEDKDGVRIEPYKGLNANVIYVSLGFGLFRTEEYSIPGVTPGEQRASRF